MFSKISRDLIRKHTPFHRSLWLTGLLTGLSASALAQWVPFPTYQLGQNRNAASGLNYPSTLATPWVVSSGQIITPAGTPVYLGTNTRAKAIALNPTGNHTAAVLQMGAPQAVTIFPRRLAPCCRRTRPTPARIKTGVVPASATRPMVSTCCSARTATPEPGALLASPV